MSEADGELVPGEEALEWLIVVLRLGSQREEDEADEMPLRAGGSWT